MNNLNRARSSLVILLFLLAVIILTSQVLGLNRLTSMLFYLSFIIILLVWIHSIKTYFTRLDLLLTFTVLMSLMFVLINAIVTNTAISFDYLKKWMMFSSTLIIFVFSSKSTIKEREKIFILRLNLALSVLLIAMFFLNRVAVYTFNGVVSKYLTFGLSNPNLTGMFLLCISLMVILYAKIISKPITWLFSISIYTLLLYFIFETKSRNALLASGLFQIMFILSLLNKEFIVRKAKLWIGIVSILPLVFALFYLLFVDKIGYYLGNFFLVSEGKNLSSRVSVWTSALQHFRGSPIIGAYSEVSGGLGGSQRHNTHIDILASYGIISFTLTITILFNVMMKYWREHRHLNQLLPLLAFGAALSLGIGEAALFSGGLGLNIFVGTFLLI